MFLLKNTIFNKTLEDKVLLKLDHVLTDAIQCLSDSSEGLEFNAEKHLYTFYGRPVPCVSDYVNYFAPFNSEEMAARCVKNPSHEHYGKSPEQVIAIWNKKRDDAAANGTQIHAFAEACCLYWQGKSRQISPEYQSRITPDGFMAETPQEEAAVRFWQDLDPLRYAVVAKETRIVNPILNYAGTFDLLLYDIVNNSFLLRDYKTNEDLLRWFGKYLKVPLNFLKDNDIGKYTLQQNLYAMHIENLGLPVSDIKLIWLKKDGSYEAVGIQKVEKAVEYAMITLPSSVTK